VKEKLFLRMLIWRRDRCCFPNK